MRTTTLAAALAGFMLGGLTVSVAAELEDEPAPAHAPVQTPPRHDSP